jgi:D-3-phosphoglycerate dehydrogenase
MELHFPYPIDSLYLEDTSIIPTGMAWDDNMDEEYGNKGVIEYYGSDEMLNGKVKNADILIVHGAAVPGFVIKQADKLKLIGCLRGGPLNIDINTAKESNIQVINTPGKNAQAVAEFTIGLIIAHQRNILNGSRYLSEGRYRPYYYNYSVTGPELQGKKIGLVGFGKIAQLLTGMIKSFGASVYVYDPFVSPSIIEEFGATSCPFDNLLSSCDIISIHARAKKDALPMFGEHQFKMMKKSAIFVNTARGGLVDYPALYKALLDKQIAGAALDVFGVEQFSFYKKLINLENVTATPHIAGSSRETVLRGALMMAEEIKRFIEGEKLQYLIV